VTGAVRATTPLGDREGLFRVQMDPRDRGESGREAVWHRWQVGPPARSRELVLGFDGHQFVMPLALRRSDVSVMEGMQTCDGMIGVAPFLGGSLRLDASLRAARYLPGTPPVPPRR